MNMKKKLLNALSISAFITFFCWGFPALKGAEVNWLHAVLAFVAFAAVTFAVSALSGGALNRLFETGGKITTADQEKKDEP